MKIKFNTPFVGFDGRELTQDGKPQMIGKIVALSLFAGTSILPTGNPERDIANKLLAYNLCQRIYNATAEVDICAEEIVLIKQAVAGLTSAGAYAQVINLIEK